MPISSLLVTKWLLLFFFFFSTAFIHQSNSLKFEYKNFSEVTDNNIADHFQFEGGDSRIYLGALQVTRDTINSDYGLANSSGRIVYEKEFRLWKSGNNGTAVVASFNTTFVINIVPKNGSGGEGLAFILASNRTLPENSYGRWMGIVNEADDGNESNQIIAIEFVTRNSSGYDVDGNHVGVGVNGIRSMVPAVPLAGHGVNLTSGRDVIVSIVYDGTSKNLSIFVAMGNTTSAIDGSNPVISSLPVDLSKYLLEDVYIGFSGSTGDQSNITQLNCVKAWSFSGADIMGKPKKLLLILCTTIGAFVVVVIACVLVIFICWRKRKSDRIKSRQKSIQDSMRDGSPRKFKLKELRSATRNFHPENKLGEGGFGTVYRGVLKDTKQKVAVKRVSKDSKQGEQEFINEITTIGKLSHKNLVKLIGWCYKSENDFLLVYELMPNGSLDKLLFSRENSNPAGVHSDQLLSWDKRHNIIKGVAHALCYLHNGCAKRVFHRDVKSGNVMLDANFDARLGDFGLARAVQQDGKTHHTTGNIFGTPGYVAPEYFLTGRANGETDVYGFGVFLMEVASGRRPYSVQCHGHGAKICINNEIVNWAWDLYGRGRIVDAVDPTLRGVFNPDQVECVLRLGLACCHPNPTERPTMRLVTQVLTGEASTPEVPTEKPAFMWPVVNMSIEPLEEFSSNMDLAPPTNVN